MIGYRQTKSGHAGWSTLRLVWAALSAFATLAIPYAASAQVCPAAYYRLPDGAGIDVAPSDDGHYRWRKPDGTSGLLSRQADGRWTSTVGWTHRSDGVVVDLTGCGAGQILFSGAVAHRIAFNTTEAHFMSDGARLAGRLLLPIGAGPVPIVVLVHGSEDSSAMSHFALQRLLPAQGVGVFVYDKRGTGSSQGAFTHDIRQLARDAAAALAEARALAGSRTGRIGYYGTSQGGWTAPLAATLGHADFVMVGYGLAVSPVEEDREALALDMTRHGFGRVEVVKAQRIGAAVYAIVRSGFRSGYPGLRRVVAQYRREPWYRYVRGNITGFIIGAPEAKVRAEGPRLLAGLIPDYDPMPVLRKLDVPQLWILGGEDIDAPYRETLRRLIALKHRGRPIAILVYPHVEHGLYAFKIEGDERLSTSQPASLLGVLAAFARGLPVDPSGDDVRLVR